MGLPQKHRDGRGDRALRVFALAALVLCCERIAISVPEIPTLQDNKIFGQLHKSIPSPQEHLGMEDSGSLLHGSALLIIANDRSEYLARCLMSVWRHHPGVSASFPIIISEDGHHAAIAQVVDDFRRKMEAKVQGIKQQTQVYHLHHNDDSDDAPHNDGGYHRLSRHYQWALSQVFGTTLRPDMEFLKPIDRVIILEEDLEIAPDFFEYFAALAPLLGTDSSLLAISAWNDNGMAGHVRDAAAVRRTDFFPGLGWMLLRRLWETEFASKWPAAYWDDWLREPSQRMGRHILVPEISRTYHFGVKGTSGGQFSNLLSQIQLNNESVSWDGTDISYVSTSDSYDSFLEQHLEAARSITWEELVSIERELVHGPAWTAARTGPLVIRYRSLYEDFGQIARALGIFDDLKAGVPRSSYKGVVEIWASGRKVYIAPESGCCSHKF